MSLIQKNHKVRRWTVSTVLVFFILTQVLSGVFFYARPAEAQLVVTDPTTGAQTTIKNIKDFLKVMVVNAGTMALINAASRFMQKISYDLAVSLASGGNGQMPLFSTEGWGDYLESAALDAAGEFIGSFGEMVGVDFCAPPNPRLGLTIQLQLAQTYADGLPPPTCEWSSIRSNWESFIAEVQTEDFLREAASQFQIGYGAGTDLDLAMSAYVGAFGVEKSASETAALTREEGQGFLPSSELISGDIKTPSEVIRQTSQIETEGPVQAEQLKWSLSGQALSSGAQGILSMMVSTFVSTLLSKTMENIFNEGMFSLADLFPEGEDTTSAEGTAWGGRRAAELAFADLLVPQIKEGGAYDILSDFIVCPEKFKGTNNCVMDGKFEAGVRQAQTGAALTVGEAIEQEYLHGEWPLHPASNVAKNQDPNCYSEGYCYSNLVKLRKARIISIGWEIAAQSQTSTEPVSLKTVVDSFHDCNAEGKADNEHPYCHLIDPNWILKAPAEQCRARVYGPLLQTTENSFRQETCVDSPTCIAEDDQGNCEGGWGYCTREKNIWRLDGDKCDAQYDTCKLLKRSDGQNVAYVTNTVDYGPPCNADDVGCRWYSTRQSKVGDIWQWQDTLTGSGTASRRSDRIFFNKNITQCDEPGCNEFLRTTAATKVNYITNSSFENYTPAAGVAGSGTPDDAIPEKFKDWEPFPMLAVSDTYFGKTAIRLPAVGSGMVDIKKPIGGTTFTLSFYAKKADAATACTGVFRLGKSFAALGPGSADLSSASDVWERFSVSYTGDDASTELAFGVTGGSGCLLDAMQLEEGSYYTVYHEGWTNTGEALYLKTAPDYYSCYDYTSAGALNKTNDAEQCGNFAKACEEKDVGCDEYRPTNGDPSVPGVANYPDDYCPAECVGYQTFKQVATDFEQDKFPVYFIPTTGRTCSAADVGCDQFTSLENEAVANFSYVRRCEKPGVTSRSFYTWEGSDTAGYQLKTWNLKMSNVLSATDPDSDPSGGIPPCTALMPDGLTCDGLSLVGLCTKADTLTNPDCREFYDAAGLKHYRLYSKTIVATDDCHPYRKTISSASDCGTSGGRWDTVKSECAYNVYLPESRSCANEAVGCRAYRGNAGANTAVILNDSFDDAADGAATGWDEADMPTISSESLVVGGKSLTFGATGTIDKSLASSVRQGGLYTLSFWAKGNSRLDIKFLGTTSADKEFSSATRNVTDLSFDWRYFSLGPVYVDWDVAGGGETFRIAAVGGTTPVYIDNIILREVQSYIYVVKNSWVTPTSCDRSFAVDTSITSMDSCVASGGSWSAERNECVLSALLPQAQLGCASYYDRTNGLHYLKSFSRLCSPDVAGCAKLLKTNNNTTATTESFNTENDSDPSLSDEERLSDNVTIPTDSFAYIVVDDAHKCAAQNKGCTEFGSPTLDATGNVKIDEGGKPVYNTVNLLANPALYNSPTGRILCQVGFLSCEEYTTTDGGKLYFKDPGKRLCEWKNNVLVGGQSVSGWFKKQEKASDPPEACDPANFTGGYYNIWKNGDANCTLPFVCQDAPGGADTDGGGDGFCSCSVPTTETPSLGRKPGTTCNVSYGKRSCPYSGWVGECIPQADRCTKFVDPADTSDDPLGAAYYYLDNDKISSGNCNGMASQSRGCVLFNDTTNPQLNYNTKTTYLNSENKAGDKGGLVAPIDCRQGGDNCKRCLEVLRRSGEPRKYYWGEACQTDSGCTQSYPGESSPLGCQALNYSYNTPSEIYTEKDGQPVSAASVINDANRLIQVRRDRVCGEWIDCSGTNSTFDSQTGRQKTLCAEVMACSRYAKVGQATAQCTKWVEEPETYRKILDKALYISRDITFKGMDYSGDSIFNQYQAPDLRGVNIGVDSNPVQALVFVGDSCFNVDGGSVDCGANPGGYCASTINGSRCGDRGKCYNHTCVTNFRGDPFAPGTVLTIDPSNAETTSCRAYPEQSSPFPTTVVAAWNGNEIKSKKPGFTGANVCERQKAAVCTKGSEVGSYCTVGGDDCETGWTCTEKYLPNACECSYKKVSYSGGAITKYFSEETGENPAFGSIPSVCVGGTTPGKICTTDANCRIGASLDGQCVSPQREDSVLGWLGYCLERDTATSINGYPDQFACLTWYPIDQLPGTDDIYNNDPETGFDIAGANFCLAPDPYKVLNYRGPFCASTGPALGMAAVLPPPGCDYDNWCDGDVGEAEQSLRCGWDLGNGFCNDEGKCCDLRNEWVVMAPCGQDGSNCTVSVGYNRTIFYCVPKRSQHLDGSACNPAVDLKGTGDTVETKWVDLHKNSLNPVGDGEMDAFIINGQVSPRMRPDTVAERTGMLDCQKVGIRSVAIGEKSYFGCKTTVQVSESIGENKAWTDQVWERSTHRIFAVAPHPEINYGYGTPNNPFGLAKQTNEMALKIPTCLKDDSSVAVLPVNPLTDSECPPGYSISPITRDSATGPVINEARPYLWVGSRTALPPGSTSCISGALACSGGGALVGDAWCNRDVSCQNYQCYEACDPSPRHSDVCSTGESCDPLGFCPSTVRPVLGVSAEARRATCQGMQASGEPIIVLGTCLNGERTDLRCENDNSCWAFSCNSLGEGVCAGTCERKGSEPPSRVEVEGDGNLALAKERISQLFAKSYGFMTWNYKGGDSGNPTLATGFFGAYESLVEEAIDITDKMGALPEGSPVVGWPAAPEVWPISECIGEQCKPLMIEGGSPINGISVNGIDGTGLTSGETPSTEPKNVVGYGGQLRATAQFFGTADKNTGPIKKVIVDWADERDVSGNTTGSYKNHLGREACNNSDFAHSTDACTDRYFSFSHLYLCNRDRLPETCADSSNPGSNGCYALNSCPEDVNGGVDGPGSCCVFRPRVQLIDNWGWCNGTCPGAPGPTSDGCYLSECAIEDTTKDHWTHFAGRVIVVPKD